MRPKIHDDFPARAPETYEELARFYVPRKIHDRISQQAATELIDWLSVRAHNKKIKSSFSIS